MIARVIYWLFHRERWSFHESHPRRKRCSCGLVHRLRWSGTPVYVAFEREDEEKSIARAAWESADRRFTESLTIVGRTGAEPRDNGGRLPRCPTGPGALLIPQGEKVCRRCGRYGTLVDGLCGDCGPINVFESQMT